MGEEPFFIDQISNFLNQVYFLNLQEDLIKLLFRKDINIDTLISNAKRFPMISDRQLIIVKEAQNLSRSIEQLLEYSKQPQKSTTIVFCYKYKSLDKRKALYKSLSKKILYLKVRRFTESNIPSWISNQLKIKGYNITPKSSHLLCEYLGNDLTKITNELDKLILVVGEDKMITDQTIESNIEYLRISIILSYKMLLQVIIIARHFRLYNTFQKSKKTLNNFNYIHTL